MQTSDKTDMLWPAIHTAQANMPAVPKNGKNPHLKSKYATLNDVMETVLPILHRAGLIVSQPPGGESGHVSVSTVLVHAASGQWVSGCITMPMPADPQKAGSLLTYLRRYTLCALLGLISDEDDDGHAVAQGGRQQAQAPQRTTVGVPSSTTHSPDEFRALWEGMGDSPEAKQWRAAILAHFAVQRPSQIQAPSVPRVLKALRGPIREAIDHGEPPAEGAVAALMGGPSDG